VKVYLYSTVGCHLCEQAKVILWPLLLQYQFRLVEVDIAESDELIEQYGTRIPVLHVNDPATELNWPFSAQEVDKLFTALAGL
jgi:glutaredoxin